MTKTTKTVLAVISAAAIIACAAIGGLAAIGKTDTDISRLSAENVRDAGGAAAGEGADNGVALMSAEIVPENYADYGISAMAESAYEITATVTDESGASPEAIQGVSFSIGWQTPASETISEYVMLSTEGNVARLAFLKAFSTPIVLTAVSELDPEITGTTVFDYAKRVIGVNISLNGWESMISGGETVSVDMPDFGESATGSAWRSAVLNFTESAVMGEGTVDGTISSLRYSITPTAELVNAIHDANSSLSDVEGMTYATPGADGSALSFADIITNTLDEALLMAPNYRASLYKAFGNAGSHFEVTLMASASNVPGRTYEFEFTLNFSNAGLKISGLTMSETKVVV